MKEETQTHVAGISAIKKINRRYPAFSAHKVGSIPLVYLIVCALCVMLASCNVNISSSGTSFGGTPIGTGDATVGTGTQGVQVFVEPDDGVSAVTNAISGAKKSVWLEMYLLTDRDVITALEDAAHRGLDVRVMLEDHPYGGGSISPTETLNTLHAAGIQTKTTSPSFALTHEKGMVIDGSTAYIMTANFTLSALGGSRSTKNREYGIIDNNSQDVQNVIGIFTADWNRANAQVSDANLVVSPINSRNNFGLLINSAQKTLQIEAEEMQDSDIQQALVNAAKRGVHVQVILPRSPSSSEGDSTGGNNGGISTIKQGGVQVEEDSHLYMHAKIIIVDGQKAFVGSENISSASLDKNRELGIIVSDQNVLNTLQQTFQQDWGESRAA